MRDRWVLLLALLLGVLAGACWILGASEPDSIASPSAVPESPIASRGGQDYPGTSLARVAVDGVASAGDSGTVEVVPLVQQGVALRVRTVTDEHDRLFGCRLWLKSPRIGSFEVPEKVLLEEFAPGLHRAPALRPGTYDLHIGLPYIADPVRSVTWTGGESQEITVLVASRADLASGVVRTSEGETVPDVFVESPGRATVEFFCPTDGNGRFLFSRTPDVDGPPVCTLRDRTGDAGVADIPIPFELEWGVLDRVIVARPRGVLRLSFRTADGSPVPDFVVHAIGGGRDTTRRRSVVGSAGVATLSRLGTGVVRLLAVPESDLLPVEGEATIASDGSGSLELVTIGGVSLVGVVTTTDGGSIGNAEVSMVRIDSVSDSAGSRSVGLARSSKRRLKPLVATKLLKQGRFEFTCDPMMRYELTVVADGYSRHVEIVLATESVFPPLKVMLEPLHVFRGSVKPSNAASWLQEYITEASIDAAKIGLWLVPFGSHQGPDVIQRRAKMLEEGAYEVSGIPKGQYRLVLRCPGATAVLDEFALQGPRVMEYPTIDLEHIRPGRIEGRAFVNDDTLKVRAVTALTEGADVHVAVSADGAFAMKAPAGSYLLRFAVVDAKGRSIDVSNAAPIQVMAGQTIVSNCTISLRRLRVRLISRSSRQGIEGVELSVDEDRGGNFRVFKSDSEGWITINPAPIGQFGLSMRGAKFGTWRPVTRLDAQSGGEVIIPIDR